MTVHLENLKISIILYINHQYIYGSLILIRVRLLIVWCWLIWIHWSTLIEEHWTNRDRITYPRCDSYGNFSILVRLCFCMFFVHSYLDLPTVICFVLTADIGWLFWHNVEYFLKSKTAVCLYVITFQLFMLFVGLCVTIEFMSVDYTNPKYFVLYS